jgi:hypothetical protein
MLRTRWIPVALAAAPLVLAAAPFALAAALLLPSTAAAVVPPYSPPAASPFESHWRDGKAELDGYRYTVIRYGEARAGQAILIYVTEPFSGASHVKVDDPRRNPADTFEALKLNVVRDFQTGIYDYNTMVSLFVRSRDFSPVKLVLSAMEWCGSVYDEAIFEPRRITDTVHSYFEGESGTRVLDGRQGGVPEDALFILLRSLRGGEVLAPGTRRAVSFLPSPFYRRLGHRELAWSTAEIERLARGERVQVPAGPFDCSVYVVRPADGRLGRYWIERAYPHRVIRWAWTPPAQAQGFMGRDGCDSGELAGSERLPYWQLNGTGKETYLRALGLAPGATAPPPAPRPPRTPPTPRPERARR